MRIRLLFGAHRYEYDLYNLIRAFYPEAGMQIQYVDEASDALTADNDAQEESGTADLTAEFDFSDGVISAALTETKTGKVIVQGDVPDDPDDPKETRDQLKRLVYSGLVEYTGHALPWGALSGIRPVRLVNRLLDAGLARDAAAEEMRRLYFVSEEKARLAAGVACEERSLLADVDTEHGYSLYVHVPFCPSICAYCTFGSHPMAQWENAVGPYLAAVETELAAIAELADGQVPTSIYVGGGTPTALDPAALEQLLGAIRRRIPTVGVREWTVEAGRPDTITEEKLALLADAGVTRISVNPQTMHQKTLDRIGRAHTTDDVVRAFSMARDAGFDNINTDIIVGLPGEGEKEVRETLAALSDLGPDGFTVHALALKRASRLRREESAADRAESFAASAAIMQETVDAAVRMGMKPYYLYRQKQIAGNFENVGYAREGCACLYNILVMEEKQTVLGAGPGATSKRIRGGAKVGRAGNVKDMRGYLARIDEMVARKQQMMQHDRKGE